MHACGHDIHIATMIGVARNMAALKSQWHGTLMLIGQPSEETIDGAKAMLSDHLYERFGKPDLAIALHDANFAAGKVSVVSGPALASATSIDVDMRGVGSHGAAPEAGKDPVVMAGEFIVEMKNEIFHPAPFSPPLEAREIGPLFEIRQYTLAPGAIPGLIERWSEKIEGRQKFSPLVAGMYTEFGALNKWVHIWAYKDAGERFRIRAEAVAKGIWPPGSPPGALLKQENMLVVPAAFSPLK